jgi:hypothetical protein
MRLPDQPELPGGRLSDGRRAAGRLAELRQRLERLPSGHPSAPDHAGDHEADAEVTDSGELAAGGDATAGGEFEAGSELEATAGLEAEPDLEPGGDVEAGGGPTGERGTAEQAGRAGRAGGRLLPGLGQGPAGHREGYRPWFTDGEPGQPWFAGEAD